MILLVVFSFIAGFVTILSPCILPVLPIVLSGSLAGGYRRPIGIVIGFIISFSLFTLFLSVIVKTTGISSDLLRNISVVTVFLFGLSLLLPNFQILMEKLFIHFSSIAPSNPKLSTGFWSGLALGVSLGLVWTPCVGPIIASVIALAATSLVTANTFMITVAYATGTAVPMLAITYGGRKLLQRVPWLLKNTLMIQKAFGILMIITAIALFFGFDRTFQSIVLEKFPQYGAGLTRIEDNPIVRNSLKSINSPQIDKNALGEPMNDTSKPPAPDLSAGGKWFNTKPLTLKSLRGKVILVDFWTYTCINCIRTLPYIKSWNEKYKDLGLVIIGVHTPEFEFEKNADNVAHALKDFAITYPVMQDNNYATWSAYNNSYWPADYLIDKNGNIVDTHFGEGDYDRTEAKIQELLKQTGATVNNKIQNPTYTIDALSPETYLGYDRLGDFASPEAIANDQLSHYSTPSMLSLNSFAYGGNWKVEQQAAIPTKGAVLEFHFNAKEVYLVLNSKNNTSSQFKVFMDGSEIHNSAKGNDVSNSIVTVTQNRLYNLIKLQKAEDHILRLEFLDNNAMVFAFTFG